MTRQLSFLFEEEKPKKITLDYHNKQDLDPAFELEKEVRKPRRDTVSPYESPIYGKNDAKPSPKALDLGLPADYLDRPDLCSDLGICRRCKTGTVYKIELSAESKERLKRVVKNNGTLGGDDRTTVRCTHCG
ncbi:hypothetical protein MF069_36595 [Paenibacillus mucilaginosus]|uniref:hypothetical protein n=1 Tax=Paenibacillus mucilaginosus TaxID=61624 RepID=UPI001EF147A9|nr:hypothetical protein [Paenibacillus mucilaginosus]MCG7218221.1 hypothetical protein [Paenibacillus mucilaginosus]